MTQLWPSSQFIWWLLFSFYVAILFFETNIEARNAFLVSHTQPTVSSRAKKKMWLELISFLVNRSLQVI